jgi:hypothetical protein
MAEKEKTEGSPQWPRHAGQCRVQGGYGNSFVTILKMKAMLGEQQNLRIEMGSNGLPWAGTNTH